MHKIGCGFRHVLQSLCLPTWVQSWAAKPIFILAIAGGTIIDISELKREAPLWVVGGKSLAKFIPIPKLEYHFVNLDIVAQLN